MEFEIKKFSSRKKPQNTNQSLNDTQPVQQQQQPLIEPQQQKQQTTPKNKEQTLQQQRITRFQEESQQFTDKQNSENNHLLKDYHRLTYTIGQEDFERNNVRNEIQLREAFEFVMNKFNCDFQGNNEINQKLENLSLSQDKENTSTFKSTEIINKFNSPEYQFLNNQLRQIRQEITMRAIENDFTLQVYITHAQQSLEYHDLDQFMQCVARLEGLITNQNLQEKLDNETFESFRNTVDGLVQARIIFYYMNKNELTYSESLIDNYSRSSLSKDNKLLQNVLRNLNSGNYLRLLRMSSLKHFKEHNDNNSYDYIHYMLHFFQPELIKRALLQYFSAYQLGVTKQSLIRLLGLQSNQQFEKVMLEHKIVSDSESLINARQSLQKMKNLQSQ